MIFRDFRNYKKFSLYNLSLGIKKLTVIHNASFNGSLISYVKQMKPGLIIMIYNDAELYEMFTKDVFYLEQQLF